MKFRIQPWDEVAKRSVWGMKNIVLIGMAGSGKSTLGVLLAKALGIPFVDTDLILQERESNLLQNIINQYGIEEFLRKEEKALLTLDVDETVIATGGSAVYSPQAMQYLKENGTIVYLKVNYNEIEKRIRNITTRGIAIEKGKTLRDIYDERIPLYEKYADIVVDSQGKDFEESLEGILKKLKEKG